MAITLCGFIFIDYFWDYTSKMTELADILKADNYKKIKFQITKTNHLVIKATINDVAGNFILDTGASSSCVDFDQVVFFNLKAKHSKTKAAGAGAIDMVTKTAHRNTLKVGHWKYNDFSLVIFDLSHVNMALEQHKAKPVQGIIGADVLIEGKAIIDYDTKFLYLR